MKKPFVLLVLILLIAISCKQTKRQDKVPIEKTQLFPDKPIGWVSDYESLFEQSQIHFLDSLIQKHEEAATNEIAVVTLNLSPFIISNERKFDSLSLSLFNKWGIGKAEKGNGICLLISSNLRRVRIEVGFGLEGKLTDAEAQHIIDSSMVPELKKGDFFSGTHKGLLAIMHEIK